MGREKCEAQGLRFALGERRHVTLFLTGIRFDPHCNTPHIRGFSAYSGFAFISMQTGADAHITGHYRLTIRTIPGATPVLGWP